MVAALVVLLMFTFGIPATSWVLPQGGYLGEIHGESIHGSDLDEVRGPMILLSALSRKTPFGIVPLRALGSILRIQVGLSLASADSLSAVYNFVVPDEEQDLEDRLWRFLVLLREAERAGIRVTESDISQFRDFVAWLSRSGLVNPYEDALLSAGQDVRQIRKSEEQLVKVLKLVALEQDATPLSTAELWEVFARYNKLARVRYVEIDSALFHSLVEVSNEELEAFYEEHKAVIPDPRQGAVGYTMPERVKVEYCPAPLDELEAEAEVSEEEMRAYYDDPLHESEFLVEDVENAETEVGDAKGEDEGASEEPAGAGPDDAVDETDAEGAEDTEASEAPAPGEEDTLDEDHASDQPRRKSFEEAKDNIRLLIARRKAALSAVGMVLKAGESIKAIADNYMGERIPLSRVALRCGLERPRMLTAADGGPLVSRRELTQLLPVGGGQAVEFAFDRTRAVFSVGYFRNAWPPFLLQILERRKPEMQPFSAAREQVRKDYVPVKALELASDFAEELASAARELGGVQALRAANAKLATDDVQEPLKLRQSELFARIDSGVGGLPGASRVTVKTTFATELNTFAVAVEPDAGKCYVLTPTEYRPPSPEKFATVGSRPLIAQYLPQKRAASLHRWFKDLLAATEPVEKKPSE